MPKVWVGQNGDIRKSEKGDILGWATRDGTMFGELLPFKEKKMQKDPRKKLKTKARRQLETSAMRKKRKEMEKRNREKKRRPKRQLGVKQKGPIGAPWSQKSQEKKKAKYTLAQLKQMCRDRKIKGYSKLKRGALEKLCLKKTKSASPEKSPSVNSLMRRLPKDIKNIVKDQLKDTEKSLREKIEECRKQEADLDKQKTLVEHKRYKLETRLKTFLSNKKLKGVPLKLTKAISDKDHSESWLGLRHFVTNIDNKAYHLGIDDYSGNGIQIAAYSESDLVDIDWSNIIDKFYESINNEYYRWGDKQQARRHDSDVDELLEELQESAAVANFNLATWKRSPTNLALANKIAQGTIQAFKKLHNKSSPLSSQQLVNNMEMEDEDFSSVSEYGDFVSQLARAYGWERVVIE